MFGFLKSQNINKGVEEFRATNGAALIDVRSKQEYRSGHIPGSINIEGATIQNASKRILDKKTPLFVYCLSGGRSSSAVRALESMGFTSVKNIGGINSYTGPIAKGN
ncbi:MAG: rhodanese-like domain-containing protein [Raoultibacter sp.]|jgi:phage shock protein E